MEGGEKMTLETLKDLELPVGDTKEQCKIMINGLIDKDCKFLSTLDLKAKAVKWVKEDKKRIERNPNFMEREFAKIILRKWMVRLNITEEDLK